MEITSIRMNKDETEIGFTEAHGTQTITSMLIDAMPPAPEFQNAFERLKTLANEVLNGLLKCEALKKIKATKVNFKKNEAGAIGCIVSLSAEIETSNRPFHFNTPLKFALAEGQEESEFYLSGKGVDLLHELQKLAGDFMNGVRAQADMFGKEDQPKPRRSLKAVVEKANADKKRSSSLIEANVIDEANRAINEKFAK